MTAAEPTAGSRRFTLLQRHLNGDVQLRVVTGAGGWFIPGSKGPRCRWIPGNGCLRGGEPPEDVRHPDHWRPAAVELSEVRLQARSGALDPSVSYNLRRGGHVLIDRNDVPSAIAAIRALGERVCDGRCSAVIFPEGTRARGGALGAFRRAGLSALLDAAPEALASHSSSASATNRCIMIPRSAVDLQASMERLRDACCERGKRFLFPWPVAS
jgi:acyltransferase-like protein